MSKAKIIDDYRRKRSTTHTLSLVVQQSAHVRRIERHLTAPATILFDENRDKISKAIGTVSRYVKYCSPHSPSYKDLVIAGRFLLVFIFLNDYNDTHTQKDFAALLKTFLATWEGIPLETPVVPSNKLQVMSRLHRDIMRRARQNAISPSRLIYLMRQAYSAFLWESITKRADIDVETFLKYRVTSIFNKQWIELWRILQGIEIDLLLSANPDIAEVEDLAAECTYLVNDLASVKRDPKKKKKNTILLIQEQKKLSLDAAVARIVLQNEHQSKKMMGLCNKLEASHGGTALKAYLDLMKVALRGNAQVVEEFNVRYDDPTQLLIRREQTK